MHRLRLPVVAAVAILAVSACGSKPQEAFPTGPTATPLSIGVEAFSLSFWPPAVREGGSSVGTVRLTQPTSQSLQLRLQPEHAAISAPAVVVVPAGSDTATFPVTTGAVSSDSDLALSVLGPTRSISNNLTVWATPPTFLSIVVEPGHPLMRLFSNATPRVTNRLTLENATFSASCFLNSVSAFVSAPSSIGNWSLTFTRRPVGPLTRGTYEGVIEAPNQGGFTQGTGATSEMYLSHDNVRCNQSRGRFVVHDIDVQANGVVNRLWITFERSSCDGSTAALAGDIRLTNPRSEVSSNVNCLR